MTREFNMELTPQEQWGWLLALDLFFAGLGGGLFLLYQVFSLPSFTAVLSVAFVVLGATVLMLELGRPLRAWRALCGPLSSWISRGVIFVTLFIVLGAVYSAVASDFLPALVPGGDTAKKTIGLIAGLSALFVTLYPGFVLAASPSIPFWNTPMLPVLFSLQSLLIASGLVLLLSALGLESGALQSVRSLGAILIVTHLALGAMYLANAKRSHLAAKEAVRLLHQGSLGRVFRAGVVLVGMIVPLVVLLWIPAATAVAGLFILIGGLLFRYCVLKAGVYVPFPLT